VSFPDSQQISIGSDLPAIGFFGGTGIFIENPALDMKSRSCQDRSVKIEELRETAALAHLNLNEDELSRAFPAFEEMLGFFAAMQAADRDLSPASGPAAGISAVARTLPSGRFRGDGELSSALAASNGGMRDGGAAKAVVEAAVEQMLDSAGERDGRFIVVPNVL
jgi:aspartyl-tRNA(Asn)/glutamyl-tRNA(Gln) amidotransferase subunit C